VGWGIGVRVGEVARSEIASWWPAVSYSALAIAPANHVTGIAWPKEGVREPPNPKSRSIGQRQVRPVALALASRRLLWWCENEL